MRAITQSSLADLRGEVAAAKRLSNNAAGGGGAYGDPAAAARRPASAPRSHPAGTLHGSLRSREAAPGHAGFSSPSSRISAALHSSGSPLGGGGGGSERPAAFGAFFTGLSVYFVRSAYTSSAPAPHSPVIFAARARRACFFR